MGGVHSVLPSKKATKKTSKFEKTDQNLANSLKKKTKNPK